MERVGLSRRIILLLAFIAETAAVSVGLTWIAFHRPIAALDSRLGRFLSALSDEPYFIFSIVVAFGAGLIINRFLPHRSAGWVWLLPTAWLIYSVARFPHWEGQGNWWLYVWSTFFGRDCGASECVYEWMYTAPFYASAAYSVGALFANQIRKDVIAHERAI